MLEFSVENARFRTLGRANSEGKQSYVRVTLFS